MEYKNVQKAYLCYCYHEGVSILRTQLKILKLSDIKPNFSELSRIYGIDRRTIKKYYYGYESKPEHHNKPSTLDKHKDPIKNKFSNKKFNSKSSL